MARGRSNNHPMKPDNGDRGNRRGNTDSIGSTLSGNTDEVPPAGTFKPENAWTPKNNVVQDGPPQGGGPGGGGGRSTTTVRRRRRHSFTAR